MKKRLLCLVLVLCLSLTIVFAACNSAQKALDNLTITQDGKQVTSSFKLPTTAGDGKYSLMWTANPSSSLTLTTVDNDVIAEPVRGSANVTVTLTATSGKASKSFTVIVPKAEDTIPAEQSAIESLSFALNGKSQTAQFTLVRTFRNFDIVWESGNTNALIIEEREGQDWLATPVRGDTTATVKIKATIKGTNYSRDDFFITVPGIDVNVIRDAYRFVKSGTTVGADFDLDTSYDYDSERKATISWEVASGAELISISEQGDRCVVNTDALTDEAQAVSLRATFTYKDTTADTTYSFKVAKVKDHGVIMHQWYEAKAGTSSDITFEGYVAGFGQNYSSGTNVALYLVDLEGCHGIYAYKTTLASKDDIPYLVPGAHVIVTGGSVDVYNGLHQLSGGKVTLIDNNKDNVGDPYAIDDEVIGNLPTLIYRTGAYVSLTNWKVKSISSDTTKKSGTVLTLEKGGVTINVGYSNYMEGFYTSSADGDANKSASLTALLSKCKGFAVGSYVSVKGLLSNYNAWQILPRSADDIVAGVEETASENGSKASAAITALKTELNSKGLDVTVANATTITLSETINGVEVRYSICDAAEVTTVANSTHNAFVINPAEDEEIVWVLATFKIGGKVVTYTYFTITTEGLDDAGKVAKVKENLTNEIETNYKLAAEVTLPTTWKYDGLTISWELENAASVSFATLTDGSKLTITNPESNSQFTLKATISLNGNTDEVTIVINVAALPFTALENTDDVSGQYIFGLYHGSKEAWYFSKGELNGFYGALSVNFADADKYTITAVDGGYTIQNSKGEYLEIIQGINSTTQKESHDVKYNESQTEGHVWTWNATYKIFVMKNGTTDYYLGTSGTYTTMSASALTYAGNATSYLARFGVANEGYAA